MSARLWWDACLAGPEDVGLAWVVLLGFVRLNTKVMARIASWLDLQHVHLVQPSERHFAHLRAELERLGTAGNLTTDADLAVQRLGTRCSALPPRPRLTRWAKPSASASRIAGAIWARVMPYSIRSA